MSKILTLQRWGSSLAVRIPATVARSAHFRVGQHVVVRPMGEPKLRLAQKLAAFNPVRHGGEAMATGRLGREVT